MTPYGLEKSTIILDLRPKLIEFFEIVQMNH